MKKFLVFTLSLLCMVIPFFLLNACSNRPGLEQFVSELRQDVFEGSADGYSLKAGYGFKETPYQTDGNVGTKVYLLTFKLSGNISTDVAYTVSFSFKDEQYSSKFKLNPVTHTLIAEIAIDGFDLKQFTVYLSCASESTPINMASTLPDDTISYVTALDTLKKDQGELIKSFSDADGNFDGEIYARIVVKDGKAYWYVGLAQGENRLKALLIDGKTAEVLAVREIFK